MMRSTKSKKVSVLHYNINIDMFEWKGMRGSRGGGWRRFIESYLRVFFRWEEEEFDRI